MTLPESTSGRHRQPERGDGAGRGMAMRPHLDPDDYTDDDGLIDLDAMRTDHHRDEGDRRRAEAKEGADLW